MSERRWSAEIRRFEFFQAREQSRAMPQCNIRVFSEVVRYVNLNRCLLVGTTKSSCLRATGSSSDRRNCGPS